MGSNTSIKEIHFYDDNFLDGKIFSLLGPFFKNNHNLNDIYIEECELVHEDALQLSSAIKDCNKSLKRIAITVTNDGRVFGIILALSKHPQLEIVRLSGMNIGRRFERTALSALLRRTTTHLQILILESINMCDNGMHILVNDLANINRLQELNLSNNEGITIKGWKKIATLLERLGSLEYLSIYGNDVGDEGALLFANALANNSTLKHLDLDDCGITREGWKSLSKLLCDASTINNTYLSNHTLQYLGDDLTTNDENPRFEDVMTDILYYLELNENENKQKVAMTKILRHHDHFNMQSFFEWEFKVLPIMIRWFTKTAALVHASFEAKVNKIKLSVIYDFIKEFPMLYIEPMTRKEIAEYTAMEEELQSGDQIGGGEQEARLNEIHQLKARAMRRVGMK